MHGCYLQKVTLQRRGYLKQLTTLTWRCLSEVQVGLQFHAFLMSTLESRQWSVSGSERVTRLTLDLTTVISCIAKFNIQQLYVLPTECIYVFCVDLRTNSDYFPIQHLLTGLYNWDGVCLLRGTDWSFIYISCCCEVWRPYHGSGG